MLVLIKVGSWILSTPAEQNVTIGFNCRKEATTQSNSPLPSTDNETCETAQFILADTPSLRTQGLSGRDSAADTAGMLFAFEDDGDHPIWMKDMHFPLHLIWLDKDFKVVDITYDVSPDTYPKTFVSAKPSRYLIELDTSFSTKEDLPFKVGDQLYY
jgi:uncharacterized membrane protein (UPF0127 family)